MSYFLSQISQKNTDALILSVKIRVICEPLSLTDFTEEHRIFYSFCDNQCNL